MIPCVATADQLRLRARVIELLARPEIAAKVRRVLVAEGWTTSQVEHARDAVVISYRTTHGLYFWKRRPTARRDYSRPAPEPAAVVVEPAGTRSRPATRGLNHCDGCGRHIGHRAEGEARLCLLCAERAA